MYFNSGAVMLAVIYFIVADCKEKRDKNKEKRVLLRSTTTGELDFHLIKLYFIGAFFNLGVIFAISTTFVFCARAGLNVGVA